MLEVEGTAAAVGRCNGVAGAAAAAVVLDLQRAACEKGADPLIPQGIGSASSTPSTCSSSSTSSGSSSHDGALGFFPGTPLHRGAATPSPVCSSCGASGAAGSCCDCALPRLPLLDSREIEACSGHTSLPIKRQDGGSGEAQPCQAGEEALGSARAEEAPRSTAAGEACSVAAEDEAGDRTAGAHALPAEGLESSLPDGSERAKQEAQGKLPGAQAEVPEPPRRAQRTEQGVPLYVMLPLDVVTKTGELRNPKALAVALQALKSAGVEGVMADVWWGLVEVQAPRHYNWAPYQALLQLVKKSGLLLQAVMSFHACGNNVGDTAYVPLPPWVRQCAEQDPAIFFQDRAGVANPECISLFSDDTPCLAGRTPLQVYEDFMRGFREAMGEDFASVVSEVAVGMGPCGELRYPSYPEGDGRWRFPGVGEFQCYDARALASLRAAAGRAGEPQWGLSGPHDAGHYNLQPQQSGFFHRSWDSAYGRFFLTWYSDALVAHQKRMLAAAVRGLHGVDAAAVPLAEARGGEEAGGAREGLGADRAAEAGQGAGPGPQNEGAEKPGSEEQARAGDAGQEGAEAEAGRDAGGEAGPRGAESSRAETHGPGNGAAGSVSDLTGSQQAQGEGQRQRYKPGPGAVHLSVKCAGIHWWYKSASHAAELTAGYYNPRGRNGYAGILAACRDFGAGLNFTCVEMRNSEQPAHAHCGPEELLNQVRVCAAQHGVPLAGENALARLDQVAYDQMVGNATSVRIALMEIPTLGEPLPTGAGVLWSSSTHPGSGSNSVMKGGVQAGAGGGGLSGGSLSPRRVEHRVPPMAGITFLRLTPKLFEERNFALFMGFVERLRAGPRQDLAAQQQAQEVGTGQGEGGDKAQRQHQHQHQHLHLQPPVASSAGPDWGGKGLSPRSVARGGGRGGGGGVVRSWELGGGAHRGGGAPARTCATHSPPQGMPQAEDRLTAEFLAYSVQRHAQGYHTGNTLLQASQHQRAHSHNQGSTPPHMGHSHHVYHSLSPIHRGFTGHSYRNEVAAGARALSPLQMYPNPGHALPPQHPRDFNHQHRPSDQ